MLKRKEVQEIAALNETVCVTGHRSPDSDTVCCAIAYANLLKELGCQARAFVLGTINNESAYILKAAGVETPPILFDASERCVILVDHSEFSQSAPGIKKARILGIVDHHIEGSALKSDPLFTDIRLLGAAATVVWSHYRKFGVEPGKAVATVLLGAILSDTRNLRALTTTPKDRRAVKELSALAGIGDTDAFYLGMYKALVSHEGKSDEEIFLSDYKEYEVGKTSYAIACVNAADEEEAEHLAERAKSFLNTRDTDMAFAKISVLLGDMPRNYLIASNEKAERLLERAFLGRLGFKGSYWIFDGGFSRKAVMVPAFNEILSAKKEK